MAFNKAQTTAIKHGEGPCLVLAGPGSGKTLTIVNRMKYLIDVLNVRPEEILVITFTKYAAKEMKQRFLKLIGQTSSPVTIGTFHGIYYGILKWAYRFGPENILSEKEKQQLVSYAISKEKLDILDMEDFLADVMSEIGFIKNSRIRAEEFVSKKCDKDAFFNIYTTYESERKKRRKIDFDDMLVLCYELFTKRPDILQLWQKKFKYVLIDEFQDINQIQYDVIKMLAAPENNLFVVGDDDQSIYGFRGADVKIMFRFLREFPSAKQVILNVNYRSTKNIFNTAKKVIRCNQTRFEKKIEAEKEMGKSVHVQEVKDVVEEQEYILDDIEKRLKEGTRAEDIAILYRINSDVRTMVEGLLKRGIPFNMREYMPNLYEHFIAKDVATYFKMALGSRKRQDFLMIMNRPNRYISRQAFEKKEVSFEDLRRFYIDKDWMQDRIDQFEWDLKMMLKMKPNVAIKHLRKKMGYEDFLRDYALEKGRKVADFFEILDELEEASVPYHSLEEWFTHVEEYTQALKNKQMHRNETTNGVRLLTMHASKGLEFNIVYIIEANEGQIPYKKSLKEHKEEEERRLFYVAMTRAKEELKISYVKIKNGREASASRFIDEIFKPARK